MAAAEALPAAARPPVGSLLITKTFRCEGVLFLQGSHVTAESELVQRILAEAPELLQPASSGS